MNLALGVPDLPSGHCWHGTWSRLPVPLVAEEADNTGTSPEGSILGGGNIYSALILLPSLFVVTGNVGTDMVGRKSAVSAGIVVGSECASGGVVGCSRGLVREEGGLRDKLRNNWGWTGGGEWCWGDVATEDGPPVSGASACDSCCIIG